jgi:site-specific DNA recombinase
MRSTMKLQIVAIEKKITQMLDRIVDADSATVISAYERKVDELERQKLVLAEKTARCGTMVKGFDESFRTALEFIANPWNLWENGTLDDKRIVLKLTLATHLQYDWNEGVRTPELSLPFKVLEDNFDREKVMAEREGFEPSIRF